MKDSGFPMAAKLYQTGLLRTERQRELLQPRSHRIKETPGVVLVLKSVTDTRTLQACWMLRWPSSQRQVSAFVVS